MWMCVVGIAQEGRCQQRPEGGSKYSGARVTGGCAWMMWEPWEKLCPQEEQYKLC